MNAEQQAKQWGQIVAEAWQDDDFKKRLMANPSAVLKQRGMDVPGGVQVRVVENNDQVVHLLLPAKPQDELSEEALDAVAGGLCGGCMAFFVQALQKGPRTGGAGGGSGSGTGTTQPQPLPPRSPPCGMG